MKNKVFYFWLGVVSGLFVWLMSDVEDGRAVKFSLVIFIGIAVIILSTKMIKSKEEEIDG